MDEKSRFNSAMAYANLSRLGAELYCTTLFPFELAFLYQDNDWKEVEFASVPKEGESVDLDEIYENYAGVKLWMRLKEAEMRICVEEDERVLALAKETKRKIIGWAYYPYGGKLLINKEKSDEVYAAVVKDVIEHGYLFSGEAFQTLDMFPVLEDYTYVDFSRRGFGALMALCHDEHGPFAYAAYSDEVEPWEDTVTPDAGLYPELSLANEDPIEIDGEIFDDIIAKAEESHDLDEALYLLPVPLPEGKYYFLNEAIYLKSKRDGQVNWFMLRLIQIHEANTPLSEGVNEESFACVCSPANPLKEKRHLVLGIDLCLI